LFCFVFLFLGFVLVFGFFFVLFFFFGFGFGYGVFLRIWFGFSFGFGLVCFFLTHVAATKCASSGRPFWKSTQRLWWTPRPRTSPCMLHDVVTTLYSLFCMPVLTSSDGYPVSIFYLRTGKCYSCLFCLVSIFGFVLFHFNFFLV
jgi:hypothetical protein